MSVDACPFCGLPDGEPLPVVSQHATGSGVTMWTRCRCGSLQVRAVDQGRVVVLSRGRPG
ncbi:hypothetical protein BLA60_13800 [Actinophytocola xinjiangensis]|uniref:Uncharacterized protein n=1 Tax=Actinophytocola xinjiangensis TaxID=485602 RepID=A0A7Z0WMS8_9PSEU|nr:hypothetical protein BLA60_13800 [Actinophytocola xinjiangensis]